MWRRPSRRAGMMPARRGLARCWLAVAMLTPARSARGPPSYSPCAAKDTRCRRTGAESIAKVPAADSSWALVGSEGDSEAGCEGGPGGVVVMAESLSPARGPFAVRQAGREDGLTLSQLRKYRN